MKDNYYDQISEGYEELHRDEQEKKMKIITSQVVVKKNYKLLDVGCGTGITTVPWNCDRTGIDPAKKLLEKAHDKNKVKYVLAKAESIPFDDNSFHVVTSVTAIQNFSDIKKGLEEIKRVGKKTFVLTFLKKSPKKEKINEYIKNLFSIKKIIEHDKDLIYICRKN